MSVLWYSLLPSQQPNPAINLAKRKHRCQRLSAVRHDRYLFMAEHGEFQKDVGSVPSTLTVCRLRGHAFVEKMLIGFDPPRQQEAKFIGQGTRSCITLASWRDPKRITSYKLARTGKCQARMVEFSCAPSRPHPLRTLRRASNDFLDEIPPAMPDLLPVRGFGGYAAWGEPDGAGRKSLRETTIASCGCARNCGVHGHDHAGAWTAKLPIADLKGFFGALGCSCWAV